ncbi:MAG TPA: hypothetical protein PLE16_07465 [Spirochaetota bacterium]|nr:hypothetical protein [Spirochaetota bacterium]HPJ15326.1 hypothetical protein [Spirochaetota bacterium]HPM34421.1 hypothetical protein [Spirochaetota bacterium]HPY01925.1 hypothetical protein [Spirochaetota bacterium]HQA51499.1 hypothetical protein [Spirochaetota bacterium]
MRYLSLLFAILFLNPIFSKDSIVKPSQGTYIINLTALQLEQISTTRTFTLNEDQKKYFKTSKNITLSVFSSKYIAPEGIPYSKWISLKEVSIDSYRMKILLKPSIPSEDELPYPDESESLSIKMIFDIKGNVIIDKNIYQIDNVKILIDNSLKKYQARDISIYLSIPPHVSDTVDLIIINKVKTIKEHARDKRIYVQDDF